MTTPRTALFTGSFDPFTIGHDDIVRRALTLFDHLVIGVGVNPDKRYMYPAEERVAAIRRLYAHEERIKVAAFDDLAVDMARRVGAQAIVKGVRSVKDFEYEREQAEWNRRLGNIETVLLCADPALATVSSTAVRQLHQFGKDTAWMIPQPDHDTEK